MTEHRAPGGAGPWIAVHVFYAASSRPVLLDCVRPLVAGLQADELIAGWWFINYWLEGPHVRLRLRPSTPDAGAGVRQRTERAVEHFLQTRPALYRVEGTFLSELYSTLFDLEGSAEEKDALVDADGRMRLRPNNSFSWEPYEPEYGKYGGPAGVALAEWHFEQSSALVLDAVESRNMHLRTVVLGLAAQLMMVMSGCFLPDRADLVALLERYHAFWQRGFSTTNYADPTGYEEAFEAMAPELARRFATVRSALSTRDLDALPGLLRRWAAHCTELRDRVTRLAERGELTFRALESDRDLHVTSPEAALTMLASPYLHMTNNRLSVTIRDEAYLSYVLARALQAPVTEVRR
jgi:thiopeptide-type bacteriocin biosynthesis protein